jgi:hypothetical protein
MRRMNLPAPAAMLRRRTGLFVAIAGGVVALVVASVAITAAVLHDPAPPQPAAATSTTAGAATSAAAPSPTPSASQGARAFGEKAEGPKSAATAHAYKQPVAANAKAPEQEGYEWGAADVEVCAKVAGFLNSSSWRLVYADHTTSENATPHSQFPKPEFPWEDRDMDAGQCIRGWITYAVPKDKRPVTVEYNPQNFRAEWAVA